MKKLTFDNVEAGEFVQVFNPSAWGPPTYLAKVTRKGKAGVWVRRVTGSRAVEEVRFTRTLTQHGDTSPPAFRSRLIARPSS